MALRFDSYASALILVSLALTGCGGPVQKEARYMQRGNALLDEGQYEKARIEYRNAAKINPTDVDVIYHLGLVDEAEGDFHDAYVAFTAAEQQNAHFHPALLKLAEYYIAAAQFEQAETRIGTVLTDDPNDAQAHAVDAALLLRQDKTAQAEPEAKAALALDVDNVLAYSVLTGIESAKGDAAKAMATIEGGIRRNPGSLPLLLARVGLVEKTVEKGGDLAPLAAAYQPVFAAAPLETKYRLKLANAYLAAGRLDQAEALLRAGVGAQPDDWDLKHQLVLFLARYRGVDQAEQEIRRMMAAAPGRTEPQDWLIELYVAHNQIPQATAYLDQVVAHSRTDAPGLDALTAQARIAYLQGDRATAARLADEVLGHDQANLNAQLVKAHIEVDNGFYRQAVADLRNIIRDRPKTREAFGLLSETLLRQGHPDLAIETLNQLLDQDPLNVAERVRLAQLYAANNDAKHAMDLLFVVTKTDPAYPVGWESTARIALAQQDWDTAEAAIGKLDALPGQHLTALLLRGELAALTGKAAVASASLMQVIDADPAAPLAEHAAPVLVATARSQGKLTEVTQYLAGLHNPAPGLIALLGDCYAAAGDYPQAAAAYDRAIASHGGTPDVYLASARLLLRANRNDEALTVLKAGIEANPADIRVPVAMAELLEKLGRFPDAATLYRQLLSKNTESDVIANNLAELIADHMAQDSGQLNEARQIAERFVASTNPLYLDTLGWVYFRQGRGPEALTVMEHALALAGKAALPPQFHYHYGAILLAAGRREDAKAELRQATVDGVHYPGLNDAGRLLASLNAQP